MKRRQFASLFASGCAAMAISRPSRAESPAPFGLAWGMPTQATKPLRVQLKPLSEPDGLAVFTVDTLPGAPYDNDWIYLDFGYANKLRRVTSTGRPARRDATAKATLARYDELSLLLTDRYGPGEVRRVDGTGIYAEQRFFVPAILSGYAERRTVFNGDGVSIELSVRAEGADGSYWSIVYDNVALIAESVQYRRARDQQRL